MEQSYKIISKFIKEQGIRGLTIGYITKRFKLDTFIIYKIIYKLMNNDEIEIIYSSTCPICNKENIAANEYQVIVCDNCKEHYIPYCTYERFRVKGHIIAK